MEDTGKLDKQGNPIKITKYEPKEGVVVFDEVNRVYNIIDVVEEPAETLNIDESCTSEENNELVF